MMESSPAAAFIMSQAQFLLQLFVIALDDPTMFGQPHQSGQSGLHRQSGQPVFGGVGFPRWPFHQQPFFRVWLVALLIPVRRANANRRKTRFQFVSGSLPPYNRPPGLLGNERASCFTATGWCCASRCNLVGGRPFPSARFGPRSLARSPDGHVLVNAHHIAQLQAADPFPKLGIVAIGGIR